MADDMQEDMVSVDGDHHMEEQDRTMQQVLAQDGDGEDGGDEEG